MLRVLGNFLAGRRRIRDRDERIEYDGVVELLEKLREKNIINGVNIYRDFQFNKSPGEIIQYLEDYLGLQEKGRVCIGTYQVFKSKSKGREKHYIDLTYTIKNETAKTFEELTIDYLVG